MARSSSAGAQKGETTIKLSVLIAAAWSLSLVGLGRGQHVSDDNFKKSLEKSNYSLDFYGNLVTSMVPVRERQKTSMCHYEVIADVNSQRIPNKIDKVLCKKESCKCSQHGDFKCTQLYANLNVTYVAEGTKPFTEFEMVTVEYACVCSKAPEGSSINLLEPIIM